MGQTMTSFVRVTGIRNGRYVEFDFAIGDDDLSVSLIMPFAAFDEFCRARSAVMLPSPIGADLPPQAAPGLYRRPDADRLPPTC